MTASKNLHDDVQQAVRGAIDAGKLRGFLLATYGGDPRASWRAKPSDMVNTIMTLVEFLTGSKPLAEKVGDLIATNARLPDDEVN